jgi:hypothetical protein
LQAVMFGFGGVQLGDTGYTQIKTKLPASWKSLEIRGVGRDGKAFSVR